MADVNSGDRLYMKLHHAIAPILGDNFEGVSEEGDGHLAFIWEPPALTDNSEFDEVLSGIRSFTHLAKNGELEIETSCDGLDFILNYSDPTTITRFGELDYSDPADRFVGETVVRILQALGYDSTRLEAELSKAIIRS